MIKNRAAQGFYYMNSFMAQMFLDPIQKRALSRSVHLEAMYFEALLYVLIEKDEGCVWGKPRKSCNSFLWCSHFDQSQFLKFRP